MSEITVTVERIAAIEPHPNADKVEIAKILGTQTIVPKGQYTVGQHVVYFPPDIMLPLSVSEGLGVQKYLKSAMFDGKRIACRVAACRLRGTPSYGFISPDIGGTWNVGDDKTEFYSAQKYEPPVRVYAGHGGGTGEVWGGLASRTSIK